MSKTIRTKLCHCPACSTAIDSATDPDGNQIPKPGNWTICFRCCEILRFNEDLSLRQLDEMEKLQLENSKDFEEFNKYIKLIKESKSVAELKRKL